MCLPRNDKSSRHDLSGFAMSSTYIQQCMVQGTFDPSSMDEVTGSSQVGFATENTVDQTTSSYREREIIPAPTILTVNNICAKTTQEEHGLV